MIDRRYIIAGGLIDGSGAGVLKNVCLVVENGVITTIKPAARLATREEAVVEDLSHCTVLPALVDCSVYLSRSPSVDQRGQLSAKEAGYAQKLDMIGKHLGYCHDHGVLGVADGDDGGCLVERYLEGDRTPGEMNIRTAGRLCRSKEDSACSRGDFLKIAYSGNIADEEDILPRFDYAALCSCLQHRDVKKTVVIANGERQVTEAIKAGCDAIEQGYGMGEENLRKMKEKDILWIPSVLQAKNGLDSASSGGDICCRFSLRYSAPGKAVPGRETFWQKVLADQLALLRLARTIGVRTAVGTGAGGMGILHGEAVAEEMKLFLKAGYSLGETVRSASAHGAEFFAMDNLGTLTVGNRATFLLIRGTTIQIPRKLPYLEGIFVNGSPSGVYRKIPVN